MRMTSLFLFAAVLLAPTASASSAVAAPAKNQALPQILTYISNGWTTLTRSMSDCGTFSDPKTQEKSALYLPADFSAPAGLRQVATKCGVSVKALPAATHKLGVIDVSSLHPQGLLYLPEPYVVPGGMFNEMYGWDSYFIIRGLLEEGQLALARDMVDNFLFEIEHYGAVLNANRTYYLTRSQPPFLTSMIRAVYNAEKTKGQGDRTWLEKAYRDATQDYQFWTEPPHLAGTTGLSRYYDFGQGPVPELGNETIQYYRTVVQYFLLHPEGSQPYLIPVPAGTTSPNIIGPQFSLVMGPSGANSQNDSTTLDKLALTAEFYKGDRSMRESGFDVTFRFGPFGAATPDFAPVGLNCLLYKEEKDLQWMSGELGLAKDSAQWESRAAARQGKINRYLWDSKHGLYFDFNFAGESRSYYSFATTFYPLWTGVASPEQAQAVVQNLHEFEQPGGVVTSVNDTGGQWDYPYGWAPIQLITIEGLRLYGYQKDADRLSLKFLSMVLENFSKDGTIREKYNVVTRSSETSVTAGYKKNVIGFGWTNGVFLTLLHELPKGEAMLLGGH